MPGPIALMIAAMAATSLQAATVELDVTGLRSERGLIHACLTRDPAHFPDCKSDPRALTQTVAGNTRTITFRGVAPGSYAVAVFHDANANRKLDTVLGIPREGFGFSRNPTITFGAPRFDKVSIQLASGFARTTIRLQYLL